MVSKLESAKKILSKSFVANHADVPADVAADLIVEATQKIKQIKAEQDADPKLAAALEIVRDLKSGYSSAKKYEEAKIAFLLNRLEELEADKQVPSKE